MYTVIVRLYAVSADGNITLVATYKNEEPTLEQAARNYINTEGEQISFIYTVEGSPPDRDGRIYRLDPDTYAGE